MACFGRRASRWRLHRWRASFGWSARWRSWPAESRRRKKEPWVMAAEAQGFVHLRVRSAYSLLEGAIKAEAIGPLAHAAGMPAVALTDRANLFGALEFSVATKDAGVQPIIGCALPVLGLGEGPPERWARMPTVVLLAQNEAGYRNLMTLSSAAYLEIEDNADPGVPWSRIVGA